MTAPKKRLIALCGYTGCGKDELAKMLVADGYFREMATELLLVLGALHNCNVVITGLRRPSHLKAIREVQSHGVLVVYLKRQSTTPPAYISALPVWLKRWFMDESEVWNEWLEREADLVLCNLEINENFYANFKEGIQRGWYGFSDRAEYLALTNQTGDIRHDPPA